MSKKTNIIIGMIIAVVTLALIVTAIVAAVKNGKQPDGPVEPPTDITTSTEKPDDPDPVIPPIDSGNGTETEKPDDGKPGTGTSTSMSNSPLTGAGMTSPALTVMSRSFLALRRIPNEEKRNQNSVAPPCGHDACRGDFASGIGVQLPDELHDNL